MPSFFKENYLSIMFEIEPSAETNQPIELVNQSGLALMLGVSKQRVHQLKEAGALPIPQGIVNGEVPVWHRETAEQFAIERNRALGKVSLQE